MREKRPLGIFLTATEAQSEGVDVILDTVASTGATAVSITPGVFAQAAPSDGVREPPLDVEARVRLLDRPCGDSGRGGGCAGLRRRCGRSTGGWHRKDTGDWWRRSPCAWGSSST